MYSKTQWMCAWVVLGLYLVPAGISAKNAKTADGLVKISVFNDAHIGPPTLAKAESVAAHVFADAGINLLWMNCGLAIEPVEQQNACSETSFPRHLHIRIRAQSSHLSLSTLGMSYLGEDGAGCQADIFYAGVADLEMETRINAATILGNAIAHELGHLLLGTNSHTATGIMRAGWRQRELAAARRGTLAFTDAQRQIMRAKLDSKAAQVAPAATNLTR
jgi:hypothetical protein